MIEGRFLNQGVWESLGDLGFTAQGFLCRLWVKDLRFLSP